MTQAVKLFWSAIFSSTTSRLGVEKVTPDKKDLEENAYLHFSQHIFEVHVATIVFILHHVTSPPPDLFLRNPVRAPKALRCPSRAVHAKVLSFCRAQCVDACCRCSMQPQSAMLVASCSWRLCDMSVGLQWSFCSVCRPLALAVRCPQLRSACSDFSALTNTHATMFVRVRSARECKGEQTDKCHAIAFHQYRATHKTKSQHITLLHLVSIYGTHPELRRWLWATQSAVMVQYAQYLDRIMEKKQVCTPRSTCPRPPARPRPCAHLFHQRCACAGLSKGTQYINQHHELPPLLLGTACHAARAAHLPRC